jgi:hypothetical protein
MADLFLAPVFADPEQPEQSADPEAISEDLNDFEFHVLRDGRIRARCLAHCCLRPLPDPRELMPPPRQPTTVLATAEDARTWAARHARRKHVRAAPDA